MAETIEALVEGGKASAGPPLGPALGPMGVNIMQIISAINEKTKDFEGMNVEIIMHAVGDKDCVADFYVNVHPGGHSFMWGFNANQDKERVRKIRMRPLADILDEHDVPIDFDFLQVDTEGFDQKIILTLLDGKRYRPRVICMEFGMEDPIPMLAERGYELLKQTITIGRYSNVIFVDKVGE